MAQSLVTLEDVYIYIYIGNLSNEKLVTKAIKNSFICVDKLKSIGIEK